MTEGELKAIEERDTLLRETDNSTETWTLIDQDVPALIAEVRVAHGLIRDYVDALSQPRLPNGDGQRVTCVVCGEWLDVHHSDDCPGLRMARFYRERFPSGITAQ